MDCSADAWTAESLMSLLDALQGHVSQPYTFSNHREPYWLLQACGGSSRTVSSGLTQLPS